MFFLSFVKFDNEVEQGKVRKSLLSGIIEPY